MSDTQQLGLIPDSLGPQSTLITLEDIKSQPGSGKVVKRGHVMKGFAEAKSWSMDQRK